MAKGGVDGCGINVVKTMLFVLNLIFWLLGCAFLGLGIYLLVKLNSYSDILTQAGHIPIGVTVLGVVVFIIGFLGCCGAVKESTMMLKIYAAFVIILLIGQIVVVAVGYMKRDDAEKWVKDSLTDAFHKAGDQSTDLGKAIVKFQKEFKCCGATSASPEMQGKFQCPPEILTTDATKVCLTSGDKAVGDCTLTGANNTTCCSCYEVTVSFVQSHLVIVLVISGVFIGIQLFGIIASCCLISSISSSAYA